MNKFAKFATPTVAALATAAASAQTAPTTAVEALESLSGTATAFGPALFGIAVASSVIVIGIAWIKKGRGAAK